MALPFAFSNNTSPTGVQLDADLAALGAMGTTLCTATGTNSITITPLANQPTVAAYTNQQIFNFVAAASSSGSVTVQVNALASLPLYLIGGSQAGSGDITIGTPYSIQYLAALNTGSGGFQIISSVPSSAAVAQSNGLVHGLSITNNSGTPNTKIDMTGGYSVLTTTGGTPKFLSSFSVTIDLTTTGANGMDTGARPTSGWVYLYVINNGSVTAGLATATSPTAGLPSPFPGGYSNFAYVGAMRCDASQNLLRSKQLGRAAQYTVVAATNTANYPIIANGSTSSVATAFAIATVVPLTSGAIALLLTTTASSFAAVGPTIVANAANFMTSVTAAANQTTLPVTFLLETSTISYDSNSASNGVQAAGWIDHYSAG